MVSPSGCKRFDSLFDRRHARAEPAGDGAQIDAATGADELPALGQARQCLIHGRPIAEVKQALGGHRSAFGQARRMRQNLFGQPCHRLSPVGNIREFLTVFKVGLGK
jgi:hypothetical protein